MSIEFEPIEPTPKAILNGVFQSHKRVMLFGEPGVGKSTLACALVRASFDTASRLLYISADPGSPPFGPPGATLVGKWTGSGWNVMDMEALCSLDAARFRLPLVSSLRKIIERQAGRPLVLEAPGVARGVAGAELLTSFAQTAKVDAVIAIVKKGATPPLKKELSALGVKVYVTEAHPLARNPNRRARAKRRTKLWNEYLEGAQETGINLDTTQIIGTPPPMELDGAWTGRQVAALDESHNTMALGEVVAKRGSVLKVRAPSTTSGCKVIIVRDARRGKDGLLATSKLTGTFNVWNAPPPDMAPPYGYSKIVGPRPVAHIGMATAFLVNGVFGDPLLHIRMRQRKRSLLFDLGEAGRLPARIAHQVSDVFISHTHIDHVGGFLWLLRSRIGYFPECRMFGPPGLAEHIAGFIRGVKWDRVGDRGPRFVIAELSQGRLERFLIETGRKNIERLNTFDISDGVILDEPEFLVRAVTLDHGMPVLAFSFEPARQINIRKDRLIDLGLSPGPWLGGFKSRVFKEDMDAEIKMPGGKIKTVAEIVKELAIISPGRKLAYATDLADTAKNRDSLIKLSTGASALFLEAGFTNDDANQAEATQHLTTRACGEIATAARVERLIPFHFSKRYEKELGKVYDEVKSACANVVMPPLTLNRP